ncbi:HAD-IIA family hydrolase [Pseudonocardia bannensis]|uniref:HAD-IIA family hydrolase n=1 Tax=Pseudonocardia bannensis TaxID=630973 RepID=A0A848DF05_9PSEU|nr:HAD-IIA family hydrolase [Pseudonocardia bannensis]NMH91166.1 HAD-IIA family hydrolase [Pseudonocardia bannensis]
MTDLLAQHDVLLVDLDGTLYRGQAAVPGAVDALAGAIRRGARTVYVTNNASRRPTEVAAHLAELGFPATEQDVMTSSQAAAAMLAEQLPAGSPVLVVGTEALAEEITGVGLAVTEDPDKAVAVVQGHSPDTGWRKLADATVALRAGAVWVACNVDPTLPTERGPLPGNGSMVAAVRTATGREPQVAGKPAPQLLRAAVVRSGAQSALVVGDRLDTDIEGGRSVGLPTLLVLTGVSDAVEVLAAPPALRPDYLAADLTALTRSAADLAVAPRPGWEVRSDDPATLVLSGDGAGSAEPALDALRSLCAAHWAGDGGAVIVRAHGDAAQRAVRELGLPTASAALDSTTVERADTAPGAHR